MESSTLIDKNLGEITIRTHVRARRIIARIVADKLVVTVPWGISHRHVIDFLSQHQDKLLQMKRMAAQRVPFIDTHYHIHTDLLDFSLTVGTKDGFYVNRSPGKTQIVCPPSVDFRAIQTWLQAAITEQLRLQAKLVLPPRLTQLAARFGFAFKSVKIQSSKSRWGSCSATNDINLSLYLMKLPSELADYVMLHELCHTVHHNHSTHFWDLMDQVTDGRAHALRERLRQYDTEL